jgi:hypothetical protein
MSYVYAIRMKDTDYVKIGKADTIKQRLNELQCGNPVELIVEQIFETNDPRDLESRCLRKLRKYRIRGEWYAIPVIDLATILPAIYLEHQTSLPLRYTASKKLHTWKVTLVNNSTVEIVARSKHVRFGVLTFLNESGELLHKFERSAWRVVDKVTD